MVSRMGSAKPWATRASSGFVSGFLIPINTAFLIMYSFLGGTLENEDDNKSSAHAEVMTVGEIVA